MQTLKDKLQKLQLQRDPYDLLDSSPDMDFQQVKKNYRMLALKYHPDRNKSDEATKNFIQISRAYEFLDKEENRLLYAQHAKAIREQQERLAAMNQQRKILIDDLKRREQEKEKRREEMAAELKRRKQFFQKMQKEEEERERLRHEIQEEMNPKEYYQRLSSVEVRWEKGLSFTSGMLQAYFSDYAEVSKVRLQSKRRQAVVVVSSIEKASEVVRVFRHSLITVDLAIKGSQRTRLLAVLQRRRAGVDFSLSTENIERLKEMMNRESNLYVRSRRQE